MADYDTLQDELVAASNRHSELEPEEQAAVVSRIQELSDTHANAIRSEAFTQIAFDRSQGADKIDYTEYLSETIDKALANPEALQTMIAEAAQRVEVSEQQQLERYKIQIIEAVENSASDIDLAPDWKERITALSAEEVHGIRTRASNDQDLDFDRDSTREEHLAYAVTSALSSPKALQSMVKDYRQEIRGMDIDEDAQPSTQISSANIESKKTIDNQELQR